MHWIPDRPWYRRRAGLLVMALFSVLLASGYAFSPKQRARPGPENTLQSAHLPETTETGSPVRKLYQAPRAVVPPAVEPPPEVEAVAAAPVWRTVEVRRGDNLSIIFDRLGLGPRKLYQVLASGDETAVLRSLLPGQKLDFQIEDGTLLALRFEPTITRQLLISRTENGFSSDMVEIELEKRPRTSSGSIDSSLFLAGQAAGLSDNLIMQLVTIFGWDIDFVLDIRKGDNFRVVFEELYRDNAKVGEGRILAAEFQNQDQLHRAVRYTAPDGQTGYYDENGVSMRKAFLRTPLKFSRISSRFNLRRKHPVLNRIRAHRGVDYAAPTGTPIKATGDGKVVLAGTKGGYGRTVILRHGGNYRTLYAHMSRISGKIRSGSSVKQGQVIGYVGKSGLATGPHLHYEFQVNGVHRNPLTVKLPKASGIANDQLEHFRQQTAIRLAQLDANRQLASSDANTHKDPQTPVDENILAANRVE